MIALLEKLAARAGNAVMEFYGKGCPVNYKSDNSPLTQADLASHKIILEGLEKTNIPVLSEESKAIPFDTRKNWSRFWLVDPLDGTKEFVKKNGEFTVNIALIENGAPVFGVVHAPALNLTFVGEKPKGAFLIKDGKRIPLKVKPPQSPLRIVCSRSHMNDETRNFLKKLPPHELVPAGSSLKFCRIAQNLADLYPRLGPTMEWDTAAAQAVLEAAGGFVVDDKGQPLKYNKKDLYNPFFLAGSDRGLLDKWLN